MQGLAFAHVLRQCLNAAPPEVRRWQVMVAGWAQAEHRLSFEQIAKFSTAAFGCVCGVCSASDAQQRGHDWSPPMREKSSRHPRLRSAVGAGYQSMR